VSAPDRPPPKVSCIIINYNTREQTRQFLASLVPEVEAVGGEILVIDNGSIDGSAAIFRSSFPTVKVMEANANLGFAKAVNLGARRATGRYLLLLNPDMVAKTGSVAAIVGFADEHSEYGIYGGRTLRSDGSLEPSSCWAAPTIWSLLMFATMLSTVFKHSPVFDPESMGRWQRDTVREVEVVTGCLMLIRRELFWQVGGMDEDYFLYGEDAEFSLRCRQRGWRAVIVPTAEMVHEVGGSSGSSGSKTCMVLAGKVTMLRKVWPRVEGAVGIRLLLAGVTVRAGLERLLRRRGPWTPAWQHRADWWIGYPGARQTLFGLDA
jgi:N-acetylglucosaminyl-diphospho-decaprenol L-rhamnosyltransferase